MPVNEQVTDSITQANTKNLGDAPAMAMALVYQSMAQAASLAAQNAVSNQHNQNLVAQSATVMGINKLLNLDPAEAISMVKTMSGNDLGQQIAQLVAAIGAGQQATKGAQTTPPETGKVE